MGAAAWELSATAGLLGASVDCGGRRVYLLQCLSGDAQVPGWDIVREVTVGGVTFRGGPGRRDAGKAAVCLLPYP